MKKMKGKLLFPMMFLVAAGGAAFTRPTKAKAFDQSVYYYDEWTFTCTPVIGQGCTVDYTTVPCSTFVDDEIQPVPLYQSGMFGVCWQPLYSGFYGD